jgi:hypothetical protein
MKPTPANIKKQSSKHDAKTRLDPSGPRNIPSAVLLCASLVVVNEEETGKQSKPSLSLSCAATSKFPLFLTFLKNTVDFVRLVAM